MADFNVRDEYEGQSRVRGSANGSAFITAVRRWNRSRALRCAAKCKPYPYGYVKRRA